MGNDELSLSISYYFLDNDLSFYLYISNHYNVSYYTNQLSSHEFLL